MDANTTPSETLLILRDAGGADDPPSDRRLARALKGLLRAYGFRCVHVSDRAAYDGRVRADLYKTQFPRAFPPDPVHGDLDADGEIVSVPPHHAGEIEL